MSGPVRTVRVDASTRLELARPRSGRGPHELWLTSADRRQRLRICTPEGWDLARIAAFVLDALTDPPNDLQEVT